MAIPDLKDKIVFITGAASGIGAAIARGFARQRCELVLADVDAEGIVKAVRKGCAHLFVGAKAPETALFKRISPGLTRKLSMRMARTIGYA